MNVKQVMKTVEKTVKNKVQIYSKSVFKSTNISLRKDILNADKILPEFKKEIKRIFQTANRRIQNIEKSGVISTAYEALDIDKDNPKFSKFSISGKNWTDLKIEYAKAVEFLRKPTSTASGAKQYINHLQKQSGLDDYQMKMVIDNIKKAGFESGFSEKIFPTRSNDLQKAVTDFYRETKSIESELETAAKDNENLIELSKAMDKDLNELFGVNVSETDKQKILNSFENFGL